jgi:hypothetical protein
MMTRANLRHAGFPVPATLALTAAGVLGQA